MLVLIRQRSVPLSGFCGDGAASRRQVDLDGDRYVPCPSQRTGVPTGSIIDCLFIDQFCRSVDKCRAAIIGSNSSADRVGRRTHGGVGLHPSNARAGAAPAIGESSYRAAECLATLTALARAPSISLRGIDRAVRRLYGCECCDANCAGNRAPIQ